MSPPEEDWSKGEVFDAWPTPYMRGEGAEFFTPSRQDRPVRWWVVYRPAAIAVAPLTADGDFLFIEQERIPAQRVFREFPAGQIDEPGFRQLDPASPEARSIMEETVRRELREEAGYELAEGGELVPLGRFFPSPGFTDEVVYLYLAKPVVAHPDGTDHDDGEAIHGVVPMGFAELRESIARGETQDALTMALFAQLVARGWE